MIRKALAWLLTLMMVISILPMSVFATEEANAEESGLTIGDNVVIIDNEEIEEPADEIELNEAQADSTSDDTTYVAYIGTQGYESVIEALLAAVDNSAAEVKILQSVREKMPTDIELVVNADLTITADSAVEVKFYNDGTKYDFIFNSNNNNTITIGENVTFQLEDRVIWLGYYGNNVDVVVNGTLAGYQIWHGADTTVNSTGTIKSTGEAFVMRRGATLTVNGGKVDANYFSILAGNIDAKNGATIECGPLWIANTGDYTNEGNVEITLNNATLTSTGNIKSATTHADGVSINITNSTASFTGTEYGASQLDASTNIVVSGGSQLTLENVTNNGTIEVESGSDFEGTVSGNQPVTPAPAVQDFVITMHYEMGFTVTYTYELGSEGTLAECIADVFGDNFDGGLLGPIASIEIDINADMTMTEPIVIPAGKTAVLDLNGHTMTYSSTTQGEAMITNRGTLTINDTVGTGEIYYNYTGAADSTYSKGNYTISNGGTLTVNGGKITIANISQHAKYPIDNNSTTGDAILVINGGHLYNYNTSAIRQFCNSTTYKNSVTINGGLIEGYCAIWVQNPGSNTVNGSLSITGGEIKSTAKAYVNGTSELKDVSSRIYFTIAGEGGAWSTDSAVSITGGTFNENVNLAVEAPAAITVAETGVTFNGYVNTPAPAVTYVAYVDSDKDGVQDDDEIAYTDLQEAIKAAAPAGTVEILSDITVDQWIMFSETLTIGDGTIITLNINGLTINGNGHTLTIKEVVSPEREDYLFYDAENLTVKDMTIKFVGSDEYDCGIGLLSGAIENVTFEGGKYAVIPGTGNVTVEGCTFNGTKSYAIYYESARDELKVNNNTFNTASGAYSITMRGGEQFTNNTINTGRVNLANSAKSTVTDNNFGTERFKVYNQATATISDNTINNLVFNDATPTQSTFTNNTLSTEAQAALDAVTAPAFELAGSGTAEDPYLINNIDDLVWFRNDVNGGNTYDGKYVKLTANINLTGEVWIPIGTSNYDKTPTTDGVKMFAGNFDGGDHIITGLSSDGYVPDSAETGSTEYSFGLFGYVYGANISNVKLANVAINCGTRTDSAGNEVYGSGIAALIGYYVPANEKTTVIYNCHVLSGTVKASNNMGGLIGHMDSQLSQPAVDITIENCSNAADVTTEAREAGGILGLMNSAREGNYYVTMRGTVTFKNCVNTGDITSLGGGAPSAGGILGRDHNQAAGQRLKIVFDSCENSGTITVTANGETHAAGIGAGYYSAGAWLIAKDCSNTGDVVVTGTGDIYAGGLISYGGVVELLNSTSTGTVTGGNGNKYVGSAASILFLDKMDDYNDTVSGYTYYLNGGTSPEYAALVDDAAYGGNFHLVETAYKDGCEFGGWYDNAELTGEAYTALNKNVKTYYAKWIGDEPVAKIDGTTFTSLQAAINAVQNGETITLLADVTENITIADGATVNLDMAGKTLNGYIAPCDPAALTVTNGNIVNTNAGASAIEINSGELTLEDVNVTSARHGVRIDGAVTATIISGEYKVNATSGTRHAVNISGAANVTIKGGTFVGPKGTTMDSGSAVCVQTGATVTIEGGNFSGGKNATLGVSGILSITGGTFDQDPSAYLAEGYGVNNSEEDSVWTVFDAEIEIYDWDDLKALDTLVESGNMLEGVTVKLMNDINLYEMGEGGEPVSFNPIGANSAYFKGTFDGQGHTIKNMYQSGWALGYDWYNYGSIGLFSYLWDATVKNLTIENAECLVEGGNVAGIAGCAWGNCTFENITIKNSTYATYNNRAAGIVGYTGGEGTMTFKNVTVDEDTVIAALWGSYDCNLGGVVGSTQSPTLFHFEDVTVACKLDCYNDVTASYKWYSYRMCGMLIGRMTTLQEGSTDVDPRGVVTMENVNITIGEWANQTYIWDDSLSKGCQRVEAGYSYGGVDVSQYPDAEITELGFSTIIGGPQSQSKGYYGSDITKLEALEGFDTSGLTVIDLALAARSAVAKIGDTTYTSLQEAIDAAQPGETVTLLTDINLANTKINTLSNRYNTYFLVDGKTVTINLNGKKIYGEYTADSMLVGVFSTDNGGHLTLTGNGTVDVTATTTVYGLIVNFEPNSSITIKDGTYKLDKAKDSLIYTDGSENVTVEGGNYTLGNIGTGENGSPWIFNASEKNENHVIVTGGTYNADVYHQYYEFEVQTPADKYYACKSNGDGTWTIVPAVAYVGEKSTSSPGYIKNVGYATLQEALDAADAGETITLLAPVVVAAGETLTLDKAVTITYTSDVPGEDMITNRGILVIDGATLIYTNTDTTATNVTVSTISCEPGSVLNITDGTVENKTVYSTGSYAYAIDLLTNGTLGDVTATISGGKIYSDYMAIRQFNNGTACKNTLTITGGEIYGAKRAIQVHLDNDAAYLTISGGEIEAGEGGYALCLFPKNATNFSVTDGEFIGTVYSGTNGFISGGTFSEELYEEYVAEGYVCEQNADGTWGVEEYVWDGVNINNLADLKAFRDAVNAGNNFEGVTVVLNADIDLSSVANWTPIGNDTNYFWGTFDGQNHTISNMTININTPDSNVFAGLFGGVRKATIKNLTMKDVEIDVVGAKVRAAAVVAIAHSNSENHTTANLNFENITVDGCTINAEAKSSSVAVGGLSGYCYPANMTGISVSNLTLNPKASGSTFAGGLVGYMQGQNISNNGNTRAYYTVDGINVNNLTINGTTNDTLAGAFAGYTYYGYITLKNATINGFKADIDVTKEALVGGLIGLAHRSDKGHTFTDVEITGIDFEIASDSGVDVIVGGMVGYSGSPIAYSECSVSGKITETVSGETSSAMAGGFVGGTVSWAQSYTDCTANVAVTGSNIVGGFTGYNGTTVTYTDCSATQEPFIGYADGTITNNNSYTASIGKVYYAYFANALAAAQPGDTVTIFAGTYNSGLTVNKAITVVGETDAEGNNLVTFNGKLSITADGAAVKNLTFVNSGTACYVGAKDVLIEGCSLTGSNGLYQSYTSGKVTFKDSTITGSTYGVHFDGYAGGEIVIDNCVITGWTSFAATIEKVTMTDTKFAEGNYNFVRLYQKEVVIDGCTFNENMKVDLAVNGATATVTKCTVENGNVEDLFYDADIVNSTITVDGVKLVRVAKIGNTYYKTFAGALTAAADGATVELLWNEGDAPIAMNGSITGNKTVTITGTATVDWSKGWLFVGYADGSNAKLIFNNATLTSTEASLKNGSYGIHVYMAKAGGSRGNGEVEFKNSTIDLSYLMGKNTVTVDGGKLTVWYGFAVGARPVSETGEQKTATMTVKNGATVEVKNHNGMGIGYESNGILYIDNATVSVTGLTVKDGSSVVLTAVDATLTAPEGLNVTTTVDGYKVVYENGAYSLAEATYIAQIGDKYYESFTEIVDAVKALSEAGTDVVVKFLTDAEITDYKAFDYGTGNITFTADKPVTITIKTDFDFAEANPIVIKVEENVTLKVYDNINGMYVYYAPSLVIEGSVTGGQNWGCLYLAYGEHTVAESGKVEIARLHLAWTDLTVYGMINNKYVLIEESDLTLGGANVTTGFFTDTNNGGLRYGESNINVINGTVVNADAVTLAHKDTILTVDKDSTFTIGNTLTNSGTINIAGKVIVNGTATNNGAIVLTAVDATLTAPEGLNVTTTVDGYEVKYANGTYSLAESAKVAEVNGVQYATLQEALNNANGATVTLLANINENVTVSKNLTIDGAKSETEKYTYTGTMTVNTDLTVTIQNVNFVKGCIAEVAGSHGNLTVKNCTFDGVDNSIGYAITVRGGDKLVIENSTAKNYSTGMLYVPSSVATISVKGVEVSDVAAAFNITYSGDATFEDVEFENVTYGIHFQIHTNGSRTYTVKNSNLSGATNPFWFWDKSNGTDKVTVVFEGENTVPTFQSTIAGYLKLAAGATLTAPAGYDVTTDVTGYVVKYEDGKYQLEKALSGSGTETDPYLITNLDELILFRDSVNAGETKYNATGVYVVLTADIDMLGENWTPIGNTTYNGKYAPVDTSKVFSGTFDGNDKVISNLTISKTVGGVDTQANVGLFGITGAGAVIKDLTINNVTINTDGRNVGALAGYTYGATLENITVNGNIQIKGGNNVSAVGGMSRYSAVTAKNITVSGNNGSTITGNNIVGGIFAEIAPNGSEHSISGLTVKNVAINGVGGVGGIVGLLTEGTVSNVSVKNVVLTGRTDYQGDAMGRIRLGSVAGLLGGKYSTISNATVENVTAKNIDGNAVVLPIIGANYEATSNATEAKIGDTYYATFAVALAAAKADDEIELLDNATVEGTVAIPAGVTIKSNGHTINGSIRMLGDLTLNGPLTITGGLWVGKSGETLTATLSGDKLTASYFMFQHGTYTINADIDAVYGYLSFEGTFEVNSTIHTTGANGEVLYINGNVTLNNGAVLDSDNSVFLCNDAAVLTMKPGSKVDSKLSITKSGAKLVIDATGLTAGEYTGITGTVTNNGNGTIEVINNDTLTAEIKNGKIVLVEKVEEKFDLFGANVNLGNNLNMKFAFAKSHVADWSGHYVEIVKNYADGTADRIEKYYFDDNQWTADGNYYVVTFTGIAAKEMTDRITVTVYDADGNAVSNPWVDSMREYAIRMLEKSSSDLQKQTIVDMLNYGAAAQTNFNYGTSDLANSTLTDEQKAYATTEVDITLNNYAKGAHYFGSNLRLTSNILFRIAFKNLSADMKAVVTFTNHKNEVISVEKNLVLDNGYYVVEIEELVVADIRQKITVSIYDGNTLVETTEESIEEYFARRIDAGTTSSAVEEAFTKFALSAKEYLK